MKSKNKGKEKMVKLNHTIQENMNFVALMIDATMKSNNSSEKDKEEIIRHLADILVLLGIVGENSEKVDPIPEEKGKVALPIMVNNKIKS